MIKGFNGGYCYKRLRTVSGAGEERYAEGPDKSNPFTHIQDALQYGVLGATRGGVDFSRPNEAAGAMFNLASSLRRFVTGEDLECV